MKEIKIPFNGWSEERIKDGTKFATSRNKKYGDKGDYFRLDGLDWLFTIDFVVKVPLWFVRAWLWKTEGADSPEEFVRVWKQIHPRKGWIEEQEVWYHVFTIEYDVERNISKLERQGK